MIRDNYREFNLMLGYDNETMIGYYEDIIKYYKSVAKDYIDKLDIAEYCSVSEILELLQDLDKAYDNGELGDSDLLEIGYHPMGAYTYCRLVKEGER